MYKKLNTSMDTIFIFKCTLIGQEKIFLLIKSEITRVTTSVHTSTNQRNRVLHLVLHHLNPPSLNRKLTSKGNLGKNLKFPKGTKGCRLKYMQTTATMDYSFVALQYILLQCIQGVPYIAFQRGNGGLNPSDLKAYGWPGVK